MSQVFEDLKALLHDQYAIFWPLMSTTNPIPHESFSC